MLLQRRNINQKARADEFGVLSMVAQDMADVLAEKALDAFPEFLDAIDVLLRHPPGAIRSIRGARLESLDLLLHLEIPGNVRDEIFQNRKSFDRLDRDR